MLTVEAALERIVANSGRQPVVASPLACASGLVLAEPIVSASDSPPFDKSLMDGYAVRNADLAGGRAELTVLGVLPAGAVADRPVTPGTAYGIMTGAPLPEGAEAVVMVERCRLLTETTVLLDDPQFKPSQNVMPRGREFQAGQTILEPGHLIGAPEIGFLATVGATRPHVYRRPRVAVLSTGDELVSPDRTPGPGQIRNSNQATVVALAERAGATVTTLGIARDNQEDLAAKVAQGLAHDVLILSGGVSAGTRDFVPIVLAELGVAEVLHGVAFKPGKPVWFGTHPGGLVFGLPGNPVSVLVCFELFVRTALRARQGHASPLPVTFAAQLAHDFHYPTSRRTYHPAKVTPHERHWTVEPVRWFGSPDLCALTAANALLICPETTDTHRQGSWMHVLLLHRD